MKTQFIYVVNFDNIPDNQDYQELTDEQFIELSDEKYTIEEFVGAFNLNDVSADTQVIRYI